MIKYFITDFFISSWLGLTDEYFIRFFLWACFCFFGLGRAWRTIVLLLVNSTMNHKLDPFNFPREQTSNFEALWKSKAHRFLVDIEINFPAGVRRDIDFLFILMNEEHLFIPYPYRFSVSEKLTSVYMTEAESVLIHTHYILICFVVKADKR